MKRRLQPDETLWQGWIRLARQQETAVRKHLRDPRASLERTVHQTRVACKRLRAQWHLLRPYCPPGIFARENDRLRQAAHALSSSRDRAIAAATVRQLLADAGDARTARALHSAWRHYLNTTKPTRPQPDAVPFRAGSASGASKRQRKTSVTMLKLLEAGRAIGISVQAMAHLPAPADSPWEILSAGLGRAYTHARRGWREIRHAEKPLPVEHFHAWRRHVKRLLDQVKPLTPVRPRSLRKLSRRLTRLGETLGEDHDLDVLAALLDAHAPLPPLASPPPVPAAPARRPGHNGHTTPTTVVPVPAANAATSTNTLTHDLPQADPTTTSATTTDTAPTSIHSSITHPSISSHPSIPAGASWIDHPLLQARRQTLRRRAMKLAKRCLRDKPSDFLRDLEPRFTAWHEPTPAPRRKKTGQVQLLMPREAADDGPE